MGDINSVKAHIIEKIFLSKLITNPFDHKYVNDIFPLEFFNTLLENIPEKSNYTPIIKTGTVSNDYSPERFIFNLLESDDIEKLSQERKHFFNDLKKILMSEDLFKAVTSQFSKTLNNRINNMNEMEKEKLKDSNFFSTRLALVKDFTQYSLGAHTDTIKKFITFLFYIPSDDKLSKIGTTLYEPTKPIANFQHHTKKETINNFKKIKTCPFVPNSVLIFPRTNNSFHGVEEVNIQQRERNLLLLNYYFDKKN